MVHTYVVINTTIFFVVRVLLLRHNYMFRPSMLAIFRLYMRNLSISLWGLFQITNLMHNSFILQQYVCCTTILNMFRAARCSSSGGQFVLLQPLVSSPSVYSRTVCAVRHKVHHVHPLHVLLPQHRNCSSEF